jgi:hypothetical protein
MFIGHFAVALGAKKADPALKLGTLFFAAQFLDLLFPILVLSGIEHVRIIQNISPFTRLDLYDYPISHSLFFSLIWSSLVGGLYFIRKKNLKGSMIIGCAVLSHWILDFISHTPDMPLIPGLHTVVGLGLWNSPVGTIIVESALFVLGIIFYLQTTKAKDKLGKILPWTIILFLAISYAANILSVPPSDPTPMAIVGLLQWLFIPWGYWIDQHRINV